MTVVDDVLGPSFTKAGRDRGSETTQSRSPESDNSAGARQIMSIYVSTRGGIGESTWLAASARQFYRKIGTQDSGLIIHVPSSPCGVILSQNGICCTAVLGKVSISPQWPRESYKRSVIPYCGSPSPTPSDKHPLRSTLKAGAPPHRV